MINPCACHSSYQDSLYGKGNRVFNLSGKPPGDTGCCTVCGGKRNIIHNKGEAPEPKKGKKK